MRVTTSLLAEAATLCDGKLYIHAGGWDVVHAPTYPSTHPKFAVVLVLEMRPDEAEEDDLEVRLVDDEDSPLIGLKGRFSVGITGGVVPGATIRVPLTFPFQAVQIPRPGKYSFKILVGGTEVHSIDFLAQVQP